MTDRPILVGQSNPHPQSKTHPFDHQSSNLHLFHHHHLPKCSLICLILIRIASITIIQCKIPRYRICSSKFVPFEDDENENAGYARHAEHEKYDLAEHDIDQDFLPEDFSDMYDE